MKWQMDFNMTKCGMPLTTRKPSQQQYTMNDQPIPRARKYDYLGVTISSSLSWKTQCDKVCNRTKRTAGPVKHGLAPQAVSSCRSSSKIAYGARFSGYQKPQLRKVVISYDGIMFTHKQTYHLVGLQSGFCKLLN